MLGSGFLAGLEVSRFSNLVPASEKLSVFDQALSQYPILKGLGLQYKMTPNANGPLLEFWHPGDPGAPDRPRPKEIDINKPGVEVYSDKVRPIDILGDVVSHQLVKSDPEISKVYEAFKSSLTEKQHDLLKQQYRYAQSNYGEDRPFEVWKETSGIPAFFRGYAFQQWPQEAVSKMYDPRQIKLFDAMMKKLSGTK